MRHARWIALLACGMLAACFAQKHDEPGSRPSPRPSASTVPGTIGLVPLNDLSGHAAGPSVTSLLEKRLCTKFAVKRLPGEGFLAGGLLVKAFQQIDGGPIVMGRISAYEFHEQRSRLLGPPNYDSVRARAVVSLSLRVLAPGGDADGGTVIWSRSVTGEEQAQWADNFRQEMGANPLSDAYVTPHGLAPVRSPESMLTAATEHALTACVPDALNALAQRDSIVSGQ